jgi:ribonucleoside-diphosphate reductase beta chain
MIKQVVKRDGSSQEFDPEKIIRAVNLALSRTTESMDSTKLEALLQNTLVALAPLEKVTVDSIHAMLPEELMKLGFFKTAAEYIRYSELRKPDIFRPRKAILPYEYPEIMSFVKAMRDSFWVHSHFTWEGDISDFHSPNTPEHYRTVYTRCALAIAQIEVSVKTFWGDIDKTLPKHEFSMLAATFDNSEAIHFDTYRFVLELVGLNNEFNNLDSYPMLKKRSESLRSAIAVPTQDRKDFLLKLIMFSTFIENVSLFSQFLIMSSFDAHEKLFSATANGIAATNLDESTHHLAGVAITEIIKKENPDLWTPELIEEIKHRAHSAIRTELDLIDWIFDNQDLPFITRDQVKSFVKTRMKDSLERIGISIYKDHKDIKFDWFEGRTTLLTNIDFFAKKGYNYNKGASFSPKSIFTEEFYAQI